MVIRGDEQTVFWRVVEVMMSGHRDAEYRFCMDFFVEIGIIWQNISDSKASSIALQ